MKDGTLWIAADIGGISILDLQHRRVLLSLPQSSFKAKNGGTHVLPFFFVLIIKKLAYKA
jgi:hypothetical protein